VGGIGGPAKSVEVDMQTKSFSDYTRRSLDIAMAGVALMLLLPLLIIISLAILVELGRPIFFVQTRLGLNGKHFEMYKFRKFRQVRDIDGLPLTMKKDPRMSRVGNFLAQTKFDELPQLYNIFRGEMSFVGPRPESLEFADCFTVSDRAVLEYRPGIFGPSQATFRNECSMYPPMSDPIQYYRAVLFPAKIKIDMSYYQTRTIMSDLKWMTFTMLSVVGVGIKPDEDLAPVFGQSINAAGAPEPLGASCRSAKQLIAD
jgi:lipopolysaccharide/colanic/teichoic acid biosynthesis glycosyltransferase